MVPHGVFPVAGDDRWIAIVCQDDDQWQALCKLAGFGPGLGDLDSADRRQREDELEQLIARWSAGASGAELEAELQRAGIACHRVQVSADLVDDPQLVHRGHFVEVDHADHGRIWVEGSRFRLSRTPASITSGGPTLGQNTFDVLLGILGYDDERLAELAVAGVLE
jgi:crotonobetainyl-CoA:carnitine CoA-transferase CaiB-like acyl-CoA transferase